VYTVVKQGCQGDYRCVFVNVLGGLQGLPWVIYRGEQSETKNAFLNILGQFLRPVKKSQNLYSLSFNAVYHNKGGTADNQLAGSLYPPGTPHFRLCGKQVSLLLNLLILRDCRKGIIHGDIIQLVVSLI